MSVLEGVTDQAFAGTFQSALRPVRLWSPLPAVRAVSSDRQYRARSAGSRRRADAAGGPKSVADGTSKDMAASASLEHTAPSPLVGIGGSCGTDPSSPLSPHSPCSRCSSSSAARVSQRDRPSSAPTGTIFSSCRGLNRSSSGRSLCARSTVSGASLGADLSSGSARPRRRATFSGSSGGAATQQHRHTLLQYHTLNCDVDPAELRRAFRKQLLRRYRSTIAAWRVLDPTRRGSCSYAHFVRAVHQLGCISDARAIWEALDSDRDGFVSLSDVDPRAARLLEDFAGVLRRACGSIEDAWKNLFISPGGSLARCSEMEFVFGAARSGFTSDARDAFRALSGDGPGVNPDDFALLDKWFKHRNSASYPASSTAAWKYYGPSVGLAQSSCSRQ